MKHEWRVRTVESTMLEKTLNELDADGFGIFAVLFATNAFTVVAKKEKPGEGSTTQRPLVT